MRKAIDYGVQGEGMLGKRTGPAQNDKMKSQRAGSCQRKGAGKRRKRAGVP